jgi:hypothetical protein
VAAVAARLGVTAWQALRRYTRVAHQWTERSRRFHLLLDAYGYDGDRHVFRAVVPDRARVQAGVIRRMADAGEAASIALLRIADLLERSAADVEELPDDFWLRR